MDERTRRTDDESAPEVRRTVPAPTIVSRAGGKRRIVIGLIILVAAILVGYLIFRSIFASSGARNPQSAAQSVGASTIGTGDIRVIVNQNDFLLTGAG